MEPGCPDPRCPLSPPISAGPTQCPLRVVVNGCRQPPARQVRAPSAPATGLNWAQCPAGGVSWSGNTHLREPEPIQSSLSDSEDGLSWNLRLRGLDGKQPRPPLLLHSSSPAPPPPAPRNRASFRSVDPKSHLPTPSFPFTPQGRVRGLTGQWVPGEGLSSGLLSAFCCVALSRWLTLSEPQTIIPVPVGEGGNTQALRDERDSVRERGALGEPPAAPCSPCFRLKGEGVPIGAPQPSG